MKINYKLINSLALISIPLIMIYMLVRNPKVVEVPVEVPVKVPVAVPTVPEYRGPPIKRYKPGRFQQMGILTNEAGDTLPLYGREVRGRRDRYHYHTTTQGEQIYPIPISINGRECTEDIGCPELFDGEQATVFGQEGVYTVKMYRTDNFF
jgi:hypothetical protein